MQENLFTARDAKDAKENHKHRENKFGDTASLRAKINHQSQVFSSEMFYCFCFSFASLASFAVSVLFEFSDRD